MKSKVLILFYIFIVLCLSGATSLDVHWGMNKNAVKNVENKEFVNESRSCLYYKDIISGYDCYLVYFFNLENQLISLKYTLDSSYTDKQVMHAYKRIRRLCGKLYGHPYKEIYIPFFSKYSELLMFLNMGNSIVCHWSYSKVSIRMRLSLDNGVLKAELEYRSTNFDE